MSIFLAVAIVSAIGLIAGLGLAVASIVMAVPVDEKAEEIEAVLPGANCGACGFSGCSGYAKALSEGKTKETSLCAPGGNEVAAKVAEIMGVSAGNIKPQTAVVMCNGTSKNTDTKLTYSGVESCKWLLSSSEVPVSVHTDALASATVQTCAHTEQFPFATVLQELILSPAVPARCA